MAFSITLSAIFLGPRAGIGMQSFDSACTSHDHTLQTQETLVISGFPEIAYELTNNLTYFSVDFFPPMSDGRLSYK